MTFFETDIKYLKGIGEKIGKLLSAQMQITTFRDLLYTFPTKYVDRNRFWQISEFSGEMPYVQLKGKFVRFAIEGEGVKRRLVALFSDNDRTMEVVWFSHIDNIAKTYTINTEYILFGKPSLFQNTWSMVHPEIDTASTLEQQQFASIYSISEKARKRGVTQRSIRRWIANALNHKNIASQAEILPSYMLAELGLMPLREALRAIHLPKSTGELEAARRRFKIEELYYIQLHILRFSRQRSKSIQGQVFPHVGQRLNQFYREILPFDLTSAQKKVVKEIRADMLGGHQMNRLLQGDVGSGKTLVAFLAALLVIDNGAQTAIMAPTEILATQHFTTLQEWCRPLGVNIALLTGSTPRAQRKFITGAIEDGSMHLLVGTHALIEEKVKFADLGLAVIDEQHRFGVAQRARMWGKNKVPPHMLVMTATPIPRTLAMTLYGDLDVSVIDELPPGRKPIKTNLFYEERKEDVWQLVGSQLKLGRQVYIVYPLIKENEKIALKSLEEGFATVKNIFGHHYQIAYVHGQMKPAEKDYQMSKFVSGEARILVSTTVIEVGVNVPNATVMVIENAERFGLSQLHQLRGRVGRGAEMSYCALVSKYKIGKDTRRRLELMTQTNDGFEIAEADMKMRGPGDIEGTQQSGLPFNIKIASLSHDADLLTLARKWALFTLDKFPGLNTKYNLDHTDNNLSIINNELKYRFGKAIDWSNIS